MRKLTMNVRSVLDYLRMNKKLLRPRQILEKREQIYRGR